METPTETPAETAETAEATEVVAEVTETAEEPPTPSRKQVTVETTQRPVPTLDADFWSSMLITKREMDKVAKSLRYSNLVVFK
mgnify:CR=1 FL=1